MIQLDTSVLIDVLTGPRRSAPALTRLVRQGNRIAVSTLVLYEWWRGPRQAMELEDQQALFPQEQAIAFDAREASIAAALYKKVKRPRGREIDLAIAACALAHEARFWTLNPADFQDVPGLRLL